MNTLLMSRPTKTDLVTVRLPDFLKADIKELADERGETLSVIVRELMRKGLEQVKRERYKRDPGASFDSELETD
jgi:predicted DNA-binding protein